MHKEIKISFVSSLIICFCSLIYADDAALLEKMVLCRHGDELNIIEDKVTNLNGYIKDSDFFYVPAKPLFAFGFEIAYVGLGGVDFFPGQNIMVKGKLQAVKEAILPLVNQKFECDVSGCGGEILNDQRIALYEHPTDESITIIQCLYLGN